MMPVSPDPHTNGAPSFDILVVDDDEPIRSALLALFEDAGYMATGAPDAAKALNVLHERQIPYVVVLDHLLPMFDGDALIRAIRTEPGLAVRTRVVYLTAVAHALPTNVVQLLHDQSIPVVHKPFDTEDLLAVVERVGSELLTQAHEASQGAGGGGW
ncbi:MAG: response regulator [Ktedonobacterales bacterium]